MRTRDIAIISAAVLVFAGVFWPGIYRYDRMVSGDRSDQTRTNRLTGRTDVLTANGWLSLSVPSGSHPTTGPLPASELSKITGRGGFQYNSSFYASLYNGSPWTVTEIEYEIRSIDASAAKSENPADRVLAAEWNRTFRSTVDLEPFTSGDDFFNVGGYSNGNTAEWRIVSAKGSRTP